MPRKNPPTGTDANLNLATLLPLFTNENKARAFLEAKRWPNGPVCPRCGSTEVYTMTAKPGSRKPVAPGTYKCAGCREYFTVRIGTIFEESKIPISKWLMAFHLVSSSKKGMSSHQLSRELGITQKSAWFLGHRIREAMRKEPMASMLGAVSGEIEIDEAYVGGKPRNKGPHNKRGRGTSKAAVLVLVERDGNATAMPIESVNSSTLHAAAKEHVIRNATIFTDELPTYNGIGEHFEGGHHSVNHHEHVYAKTDENGLLVTTNTAESFFALLKRSHYGIHHQMSKQHLHRYVNERSFMWDHRKISDGERMVAAVKGAEGKRLMYREPIGKEPKGLVVSESSRIGE
jgi:transposase-like protein